jgi:hypothetical protein
MITELVEIFSALELQSLLPRARRTGVIEIDLSVSPAPRSYLSAAKLVGSALTIALSTQRNDCQNSQCFFFKAGSSFLTCGALAAGKPSPVPTGRTKFLSEHQTVSKNQ